MAEQSNTIGTDLGGFDGAATVEGLNRFLRLRTTPIVMKRFRTVEEMNAVPKIRRPDAVHAMDQIVGQAARNGWTVGITAEDLVGAQCGVVVGLHDRDETWLSGDRMTGVWYKTAEDAAAHQAAMNHASIGTHEALAVSPLASGRLNPPDICLIYATTAQMILFINGLQWTGYKVDGAAGNPPRGLRGGPWPRTAQPVHSLLCGTALRRCHGDELLMAIPALPRCSMAWPAARNGLRYIALRREQRCPRRHGR